MDNADTYYSKYYRETQRSGLQGWGNSLIDRRVARHRARAASSYSSLKVLELGASSGEHLNFEDVESFKNWIGIDLRPGITDPENTRSLQLSSKMAFVAGDVEQLPFPDNSFDQVVSTCVLHHLERVENALAEVRRVLRVGGTFVVSMPTDPGLANQLIKQLITYRAMRRSGILNPRLEYAREHRNHIGALLTLCEHTFAGDETALRYYPFRFVKSWNLNLIATFVARKTSD